MSLKKNTPLVDFELLTTPASDLSLPGTEITVHLISAGNVVLKYKTGMPAGYDGDITVDPVLTYKCSVVATYAQRQLILQGKFVAEIEYKYPHTGYPDFRVVKERALLDSFDNTTI